MVSHSPSLPASIAGSDALDLACQGRGAAEHSGVERELRAVVFLVCDAVVHPGQTRAVPAVEPADLLQHLHFTRVPDPPGAEMKTASQQFQPVAPGRRPATSPA